MRILAVDPGDKRIGIAVSDPTKTIANPLLILKHIKRSVDAGKITQIAQEWNVEKIVIGQALDSEGNLTPQARKSKRLAEEIRKLIDVPIVMWDESSSTMEARKVKAVLRPKNRKHDTHLDDIAATVILQSYMDSIVTNES